MITSVCRGGFYKPDSVTQVVLCPGYILLMWHYWFQEGYALIFEDKMYPSTLVLKVFFAHFVSDPLFCFLLLFPLFHWSYFLLPYSLLSLPLTINSVFYLLCSFSNTSTLIVLWFLTLALLVPLFLFSCVSFVLLFNFLLHPSLPTLITLCLACSFTPHFPPQFQ